MTKQKNNQLLQPIKQYWHKWLEHRRQMTYQERKQQTIFMTITAICCVVMLFCGISFYHSLTQYQSLKKEELTEKNEYKKMKKEKTSLQKEVAQLKDSSYVEKLARARFFLSKEGEQIYIFPQESDEKEASTSSEMMTTQSTEIQEGTSETTTNSN